MAHGIAGTLGRHGDRCIATMVLLGQSRPEVVPGRIAHQTVTVPQAVTFVDEAESQRAVENELAVLDRPMIPDDAWLARLQEDLVAVGSAIRASEASTPESERTALAQISEATWNRQVKRLIDEYLLEIPLVDNDLDAEASARGRLLVRLNSGRVVRPTTVIRIDQNPMASDLTNAIFERDSPKKPLHHWPSKSLGPNAQPTITLDRDRRAQLELQARDQTPQVVEAVRSRTNPVACRATGTRGTTGRRQKNLRRDRAARMVRIWNCIFAVPVGDGPSGRFFRPSPSQTHTSCHSSGHVPQPLIGLLAIPVLAWRTPARRPRCRGHCHCCLWHHQCFTGLRPDAGRHCRWNPWCAGSIGRASFPFMLAPGVVAGAAVMAARLGNFEDRATILSAAGRSARGVCSWSRRRRMDQSSSGTEGLFGQGAARAFAAWLTTLLIGFLAMGLLPTMERWFDRVTGMTLAELVILATPCCKNLPLVHRGPTTTRCKWRLLWKQA